MCCAAMPPGFARGVPSRLVGGGMFAVLLRFRRDRRLLAGIRGGCHILAGKGRLPVDPGGLRRRFVGKVRRRVAWCTEILAAVGGHLGSKRRTGRQRKAGGRERNLQPNLHDFSPLTSPPYRSWAAKG